MKIKLNKMFVFWLLSVFVMIAIVTNSQDLLTFQSGMIMANIKVMASWGALVVFGFYTSVLSLIGFTRFCIYINKFIEWT